VGAIKKRVAPLVATKVKSDGLEAAIEAVIGPAWKARPMSELDNLELVMAVNHSSASPVHFRLYGGTPALVSVGDVALATSPAPGYFPPRTKTDGLVVDGDIIANAPDMQALADACEILGADLKVSEQQRGAVDREYRQDRGSETGPG
jgi:hypothetical protein